MACLGRILQHERLPDGRFNFLLLGRKRVRLGREVPSGKLYRTAFTKYTEIAPERTDATGLRIGRSANHLADTLASVPVIVFFLMPRLPSLVEGIDIGPVHASVYPAVQNFCLAARALGLGTTLTTVIRVHQAETLELLGVPAKWEIAAMVPLGHPAERFSVAKRRDVSKLTSFNRWS